MRRTFLSLMGALLLLPLGLMSSYAQEATPANDLSRYPEVGVTITDTGFEITVDPIPAGYILLKVTNSTDQDIGAGLFGIPAGETLDALMQETPEPGNFLPPSFYRIPIAGGPSSVPSGETREQVVYVTAGDWLVGGEGDQPPMQVTVAETADSVMDAPAADVVVTESNFAFSGFDKVHAGQQVWEVHNVGDQPHMLVLFQVPDGTTLQDVVAAMSQGDNATPAPGMLQESDIRLVDGGQILLQSEGTSVWTAVDMQPGTYVANCFVIDPATGLPHIMEGMLALFQVSGDGAVATPAN